MKRRSLCQSAAAALLCASQGAGAQAKRPARIGVLSTSPQQAAGEKAMLSRLADLGWSAGWFGSGNLTIEYREVAPAATDVAAVVTALAATNCELIVATTTPLAVAAKGAAPSIPLVFLVGGDPVDAGLVASMARPGGNATGLSWAPHQWGTKLVDLMEDLAPRAKRVSVIAGAAYLDVLQKVLGVLDTHAARADIKLQLLPVSKPDDVRALDAKWAREPIDGVIVFFDAVTIANMGGIVGLIASHRRPAVYASRYFVDAGGLLSYGINWPAEMARTADVVARVLAGTKPADIPVETALNFELVVNLRTARSLGISVPPSVLAQANEVVQ